MKSTRRTYTSEFKIEAVRLLTEEGYSTRQAAESLGVSQNALRTWRKRLENEASRHRSRRRLTLRRRRLEYHCRVGG